MSFVSSYHSPFKHSGLIQNGDPTVSNRLFPLNRKKKSNVS